MKKEVSRRQFLAGVGAAGLATAGAGLVGCVSETDSDKGSENVASTPSPSDSNDSEFLWTASINPQDYDFRQNTTDFKELFSSLTIGAMTTSHRMIKSAAGSATYLAGPTDELLDYYVNMAKGGVEIIWIEMISWMEPNAAKRPDGVTEEDAKAFSRKLVEECGAYGAQLGYQTYGVPTVSPNDMTTEDIVATQDRYVELAQWLKDSGFMALEINAAGFNLGEHFLSRFHNERTDEYGADSIENRARFIVESITKIKDACGDDFGVQILMDCAEENDNITNDAGLATMDNMVTEPHNRVTTIEEGIEFAKLFEAAGADSLHLRLGPLGYHPCQFASDLYFLLNGIEGATGYGMQWDFSKHWEGQLIGNHSGAGMTLDIASRYKAAVNIPCGTVTYMDPAIAPDFFEQAIADGKIDFFLMNRPFTVDSEYVNKLREGRIDEIAPCTRCLHCHIGSNEGNRMFGYCRVNALTQRVMTENGPDSYELTPAESPKNVMVVGGGPAGMEAARIAAARGHKVSLYEKNSYLGGLLDFAHMIKGPHENLDLFKNYLIRQQDVNGVTITLDQEVDAALVESEAPDALILATGGLREELDISGDVPIVDFNSFMTADLGEKVIIWGSNAQAFDCALWCVVRKKKVTIVTPNDNVDLNKEQSQHAHRFLTTALYALGLKVYPNASIKDVGSNQITVATGWETEVILEADSIIVGAQMISNNSLLEEVSVAETYAIGDCEDPFNIALAIRGGNDIGRIV